MSRIMRIQRYSRINTAAAPMPVPIHIDVTSTFPPRRFSSFSPVTTCRAPVQRKGAVVVGVRIHF